MKESLYYFHQLTKQQQRIYQEIQAGLQSLSDAFEIPRVSGEELSRIFAMIRLDCPEIFFASTFHYSYYENSNQIIMKPEYMFDKSKIREQQKSLTARVEKLVRPWRELDSLQQEMSIHDFICENVTYDKLKKQYSHEIIGPLGQGVGVCEGIAKAVKILSDALDLPCIIAISENNPEKNIKYRHAWNVIQLQGRWYHLDATFDNTLGQKEVRYDYMNLNDKSIFRDHEPLIYPVPECSDGERFYYREKKLSFTKLEDVKKRCEQAMKKGRTLTFHWRGGYLTREILEELLRMITLTSEEKGRHCKVSLNRSQAVIRVSFPQELAEDSVKMEDAYEEENSTN